MSVTFNRPRGMKYTDMCIYIDAHMPEIVEANAHPDVEAKIFEYLYHIIYALSCKSGYFKRFEDYDSFACYAATELYISMRDKLINAGKEVHGKVITPVKSCLNFIKAVMFPLKINYQRENFGDVLDPAFCDTSVMEHNMREDIQSQYRGDLEESFLDAAEQVPKFLKEIISRSPFRDDPVFCKKLYLSCLLTLINSLTLPNKLRNKFGEKLPNVNSDKITQKYSAAYVANSNLEVIRWHIDEEIDNYIRLLVIQAKKIVSKTVHYYIHSDDLSDELLDNVIKTAYEANTAVEQEDME